MHLDALALACVVHELRALGVPARVQQVLMPDAQTVALELYAQRQRRYLSLHVQGPTSFLALQAKKPRRGEAGTASMLELLRKYGRGGLLTDLVQPNPVERVVAVHLSHRQHGPTRLLLELTGRRSNLLLTNPEGRILGRLHSVSSKASRPLRPGQPYVPPPLPDRLSPLDCTQATLAGQLALCGQAKAVQALPRVLAGMGPTQAREIVYRVTGSVEAETRALDPHLLLQVLGELWRPVATGQWQPSQVTREGQPRVVAPFLIRHLPDAQPLAQLHEVWAEQSPDDPYHEARNAVQQAVQKSRDRARRRLEATRQDLPQEGASAALRWQAQWLLALQSRIAPRQESVCIPGEEDGPKIEIRLRPDMTPVQQAEGMFKRARKLERATQILPGRLRELARDLDYLDQLALDLAAAQDRADIEAVRLDLEASGLYRPQQRQRQARPPQPTRSHRIFVSADGFRILVGRNARQNDRVTFTHAAARDLWLHARGQPGSHVVVCTGGQAVAPETVAAAAQLAAYYSQSRGESKVPVTVTAKRHVTRLKGGRPGQVRLRKGQADTVVVNATLPDLAEI